MTLLTRKTVPDDLPAQAFDPLVSASRSSRRTASPVRLSMSVVLGGEIDGAWWPRTGSMVRELPDLIEALRPALGEIIDIRLNWSAGSVTPLMGGVAAAAATNSGASMPRHRLMAIGGRNAGTRLLVVPAVTPATLALMVLRCAGVRRISDLDRAGPTYERADRIVRAARAESAAWNAEGAGQGPAGASTTNAGS